MKISKWLIGLITGIGGILAIILGINKNKKIKELKKDIKKVNKSIKNKQKQSDAIEKSLESKKEALKELKSEKYKKKDVGTKEASDFLKKYANKKNKRGK